MPKPHWDLEENKGFVEIKAWDGLYYKVWNSGTPQTLQKVANTLANVRNSINKLLVYIYHNPQLWKGHPIEWGIYHTFDIHAPGCGDAVFNSNDPLKNIIKKPNLFVYQEMTANKQGFLGLNKPKKCKDIKVNINGKIRDYEVATERLIMLTTRSDIFNKPNKIDNYAKILDLALHELTHTTCNDTRWKSDNHQKPFNQWNKMIENWADNSKN